MMNKTLHIVTPSHTYQHRSHILHRAIDSVLAQKPHGLQVKHHIIFDGEAPENLPLPPLPAWYQYEIVATERTAVYGAHQRNVGISRSDSGWVLFLDDDNTITDDCCSIIESRLQEDIGVLFFCVWHAELNCNVPADMNTIPKYGDIDSLCYVIQSQIANLAEWQALYHHDFLYIQNIVSIAEHLGYRIVHYEDVIGTHT
ncbi:MAG: glycosyltransferase family 2 protein [bacterium]|nr:glycosyltransferase family 2 protein [bacterium]